MSKAKELARELLQMSTWDFQIDALSAALEAELVEALQSAAAELDRLANPWRPIEEAPREPSDPNCRYGPEILGCSERGIVAVWRWDSQRFHADPKPYWTRFMFPKRIDLLDQPIMFQPLPEPPTTNP